MTGCEHVGKYSKKVCSGDCGESLYEDAQMALINALDMKPTNTRSDCFHPIMDLVYKGKTVKIHYDEDTETVIFDHLNEKDWPIYYNCKVSNEEREDMH